MNNKTVNSDYVGVCLHKQSRVVYLKVNLIKVCFKLSLIYIKENISVLKGILYIPGKYSSDA